MQIYNFMLDELASNGSAGFKKLSSFPVENLQKIILYLDGTTPDSEFLKNPSEYVDLIIDNLSSYYEDKDDLMVLEKQVGFYVEVIFLIYLISCHCIRSSLSPK